MPQQVIAANQGGSKQSSAPLKSSPNKQIFTFGSNDKKPKGINREEQSLEYINPNTVGDKPYLAKHFEFKNRIDSLYLEMNKPVPYGSKRA